MLVRGVRGATTTTANTPQAIWSATQELLAAMVTANGIEEEHVASVIFTTTPDLDAAYPAKAARDFGWTRTALMGCVEMAVPDAVPRCIRILIHWNTDKTIDAIQHVFLHGATILRPDLQPIQPVQNGGDKP